ncbi:hypothetical protein F5B22DRAFT_610544 [Xylaria bambusicola]|uniref:uncharacterized protein n=1 Tax=Xylaria bambusicola TaxID=326684 RepID=UPI00200874B2|nr:uncharacterized protein F5B22DRAFT_610544 [Xylaria bambusicola]KAI0514737.1 hypothetical protein F5B22DRAFT_610544 [Xylaria bambusicola]
MFQHEAQATMPRFEHQYAPVGSSSDDVESTHASEEIVSPNEKDFRFLGSNSRLRWRLFGPVAWSLTTFLLVAVVCLLGAAVTREPNEAECIAKTSSWSPAFEAVRYRNIKWQNTFSEKSIYRGKPTKELEQAWSDLWNFGPVNIPYSELDRMNKSREVTWARAKPEDGGGLIGSLEVFHHIHCLDLVRQYVHRDEWDYSDQPAFDGTPEQVLEHVDHCINSLRMVLQCTADVSPFLIKSDPKRPLGIDPDFNSQHKCRDFEAIRKWAREHQLDRKKYEKDISNHHGH